MTKLIYNYDSQTGEFMNEAPADESPLEPGVILLAAFSTALQPPPTASHEVAVFTDGQWCVKADWRGVPLFNLEDGSPVTLAEIGKTPADVGATDQAMPSSAHVWKNDAWQLDAEKQVVLLQQAKQQALATIDQLHAEAVQQLVGNPTQVEKDTWALKLEVAGSLAKQAGVSFAGEAFLASAGLETSEARATWAASVRMKAAAYARVVGLAESQRNVARTAVRVATDMVALDEALQEAQRLMASLNAAVA
ncbi:MAG: hypothetical protein LWW92_02540 [Rhodocyclales bacterium]|nr:hypothetical protein [Rhodocyclales bacterium]